MMIARVSLSHLATVSRASRSSFAALQCTSKAFATHAINVPPHATPKSSDDSKAKTQAKEPCVTEEEASIPHFLQSSTKHPIFQKEKDTVKWENLMHHPVYNLEKIATIEQTHHDITETHERVAFLAVKTLRKGFDWASRYKGPGGEMTKEDWIRRCLFLETVAGVPGMVGGMLRHLRSLRTMKRDYGWIHTLLEEAENERMHLLTFMNMKKPGILFRSAVIIAQGVFYNMFFITYLFSPKTCHRFVGYLEEEAVKTYTGLLQDIQDGHLKEWAQEKPPMIAKTYYKLPDDARLEELIKCIRADEANHRDVNHTFASLDQHSSVNPFIFKKPGENL